MKKKMIAILLAALMIVGLLPAAAFAATGYGVFVNGTEFTDEVTTISCGMGSATLDTTKTPYELTLNNATISVDADNDGNNRFGIQSKSALDIVLKGENKIELADSTVKQSKNYGIETGNKALTISAESDGTLLVKAGGKCNSSIGIHSGAFTLNCPIKASGEFSAIKTNGMTFAEGLYPYGAKSVTAAETDYVPLTPITNTEANPISTELYSKADTTDKARVVVFEALSAHNVNAQVQGSHGQAKAEIESSEVTEAVKDANVVFTATADSGYVFDYWEVVSGGVDIEATKTNNPITVTMPDTALTLKAHFEVEVPEAYNIIVEDDGHGTAKAQVESGDVTSAAPEAEVTLIASPAEGYAFKEWQIIRGLESITGDTFTMPANEVKIKAIFVRVYNINLQDNGHGTAVAKIGDTEVTAAESGKSITLVPQAAEGYVFDAWEIVSGTFGIESNGFTMPESNVTVKATFKSIGSKADQTAPAKGEGYTIDIVNGKIIPKEGYEIRGEIGRFTDKELPLRYDVPYYVRKAEDAEHNPSDATELIVTIDTVKKAAIDELEATMGKWPCSCIRGIVLAAKCEISEAKTPEQVNCIKVKAIQAIRCHKHVEKQSKGIVVTVVKTVAVVTKTIGYLIGKFF